MTLLCAVVENLETRVRCGTYGQTAQNMGLRNVIGSSFQPNRRRKDYLSGCNIYRKLRGGGVQIDL